MKKSVFLCGVLCGAMVLLSGCGNQIPEMNETTEKLVVEYAAAVVREHDTNRTSKLLEKEVLQEALEEEARMEAIFNTEPVESEEEAEENKEASESGTGTEIIDNTENNDSVNQMTIEEAVALDEIGITYAGYEVTTEYPQAAENIYFSMGASEGCNLIVLKFDVTNLSQTDKTLNMLEKGIRYKISVNGESKNTLTTMLLNDLSSYQGTIAAGAQEQLVLVCEVPEEEAQTISEISLNVTNAEQTATISLN